MLVGKQNGHRFKFEVVCRHFVGEGRKVTDREGQTYVDGKLAYGTDGGMPPTEIIWFSVIIDGRKFEVPRGLWADLFFLSMEQGAFRKPDGSFRIYHWGWHLDKQGTLTLGTLSGDAAGTYSVRWWFRHGESARRIARWGEWTLPPHPWREVS